MVDDEEIENLPHGLDLPVDESAALEQQADALIGIVRGTWSAPDPVVLVFGGEEMPIVACVNGDLRYISSRLIYPRESNSEDIVAAIERRGLPRVDNLSNQSAHVDREWFEKEFDGGDGDA